MRRKKIKKKKEDYSISYSSFTPINFIIISFPHFPRIQIASRDLSCCNLVLRWSSIRDLTVVSLQYSKTNAWTPKLATKTKVIKVPTKLGITPSRERSLCGKDLQGGHFSLREISLCGKDLRGGHFLFGKSACVAKTSAGGTSIYEKRKWTIETGAQRKRRVAGQFTLRSVIHSLRLKRNNLITSYKARSRDKILIEPSHSSKKLD